MATRRAGVSRRERDGDESEERRPLNRSKAAPGMAPVIGVVILIGGGMGLAGWLKENKEEPKTSAAPASTESPFAHIAEEVPPTRSGGGSSRPARRYTEDAPAGLASDPTWVEATRIADEAMALEAEAWEARDGGKFVVAREKSNEAKLKIDQALTMTSLFLDGLVEKYGETDRQVSKIRRAQRDWQDLLLRVRIK